MSTALNLFQTSSAATSRVEGGSASRSRASSAFSSSGSSGRFSSELNARVDQAPREEVKQEPAPASRESAPPKKVSKPKQAKDASNRSDAEAPTEVTGTETTKPETSSEIPTEQVTDTSEAPIEDDVDANQPVPPQHADGEVLDPQFLPQVLLDLTVPNTPQPVISSTDELPEAPILDLGEIETPVAVDDKEPLATSELNLTSPNLNVTASDAVATLLPGDLNLSANTSTSTVSLDTTQSNATAVDTSQVKPQLHPAQKPAATPFMSTEASSMTPGQASEQSEGVELPTGFEADTSETDVTAEIAKPAVVEHSKVTIDSDPTTVLSGQSVTVENKTLHAPAFSHPSSPISYTPEARFANANVPNIVSSVQGQLLPNGGTMTLRLDPPEIGALQVAVTMKDGLASVSFQTDNPEAARMMSNTLGDLRNSLNAAGVSIDKMSVQQAPKSETSSNNNSNSNDSSDPRQQHNPFAQDDRRRDQQRRELLERMWRKVAGEDVNLVA